MSDDWCAENDGAYRAELAERHRAQTQNEAARVDARIRQLEAERDAAYRRGLEDAAGYVDKAPDGSLSYQVAAAIRALAK